jgi:protoporphyrinogen/coproporphyrinogen III oxidase
MDQGDDPLLQPMKRVAIIGAGISGLTTAWKLQKGGAEVVVFDPAEQAGGVIRSLRHEGYLLELGPNTVLVKGGELAELIEGAGLEQEVQHPQPEARKRFILHQGQPVAAPSSAGSFFASPLLDFSGKMRLLSEPFRSAGTSGDESVSAFFSRRLGSGAVDHLIDPFVSGIYAGDPVRLSARFCFPKLWEWERSAGSLVRGALRHRKPGSVAPRMLSFRDGLQALPQRLAESLGSRWRREKVEHISRDRGKGGWAVNGQGGFTEVVCTLPPWALDPLLRTSFPGSATIPGGRYPVSSVRVWHFGVSRGQVGHALDGFGVLAPSGEKQSILGILFSSSIFSGRAPSGCVLLTVFQGGVRQPELCAADPAMEALARSQAWEAAGRWLDIRGEPSMAHHQLWNPAIPQYEVGHQSRLDAMEKFEKAEPGLHIRGNLRGGVSVSDCVASAFRTAETILKPS